MSETLAISGYPAPRTLLPFGGILFWDAGDPKRADFDGGRNVFELVDARTSRPVRELAPPIALSDDAARFAQVSTTLGVLYTRPGPFAVSRDGRRLAIATNGAVFIKELDAR